MELKVFEDYPELSVAVATVIIECIRDNPHAVICFASGDTPRLAYQVVADMARKENINMQQCSFIGLDEWLGIPPDNAGSCHYFLQQLLFIPIGARPSQVYLFDAMTANEEEECEKMNNVIVAKGGIDLMIAGVGMNGHIGFNEPGTDIRSLAHVAVLDDTTRTVGQKYFRDKVVISKGITVGLKQVMEAKTLLMMANGQKKATVIRKAVEESISADFPASLIQQHPHAILMTDKEAASALATRIK
ncbi:MAG: glucosamine-6-phosphate deaminase [Chitinophagaceae bacterium]|nr:glucosamine-6-phosphate deaminase [Chitinophagaceae bacterium]